MARISGINLPKEKRIDIGLTSIFGIGRTSARKILERAEVPRNKRCGDLSGEEITSIRKIVNTEYQTEGDLRRIYAQSIKRLKEIGSAAGRRHRVRLPVRGQRTRTNARTRKRKIPQ